MSGEQTLPPVVAPIERGLQEQSGQILDDRIAIDPTQNIEFHLLLWDGGRYVELCSEDGPLKTTRIYDSEIADLSGMRPCQACQFVQEQQFEGDAQ